MWQQHKGPAWVAQLDARPTGDQVVAGSSPAGSAPFFRGEIFSTVILSLPLVQEGQKQKNVHNSG